MIKTIYSLIHTNTRKNISHTFMDFILLTILIQFFINIPVYAFVHPDASIRPQKSVSIIVDADSPSHYYHTSPLIKKYNLNYHAHYGQINYVDSTKNKRELLPDIRFAATKYVKDTWKICTSPARLNWKSTAIVAGIGSASLLLYKYDEEILRQCRRNYENTHYKNFIKMGEFFGPVGLMGKTNKYYFAGLATGYLFNINKLTLASAQLLESHFIAGSFKNIMNLVGRERPYEGFGAYEFNDGTSFPSGHASSIFQVATILSYHIHNVPFTVAAYTIATSVAIQRIQSNSHWPSDVFFAAVYGTAISKAIIKFHENDRKKSIKPSFSYISNTFLLSMQVNF